MKKFLLTICSFFLCVGLFAQSGGAIQGKVVDPDLGEGLPFATVSVSVNGSLIGAQTDFDGFYSIKPIPPGKYDVSVKYVGYRESLTKDVVVTTDKITFLDIDLLAESELLSEVVVIEYKVPLMEADETATGNTVTKEEIANLPTRNVNSVAATTAGVYQSDEGGSLNIKGSRSEGTDYYIDGIKVRGSSAVPQQAIEQLTVITGGVPAKYGDATGGIISITTRGPSSQFAGGVEVLSSQFTDPYNYNLLTGAVSGPILKKNKGKEGERAILGFFIAAEYLYEKDDRPSHFKIPRVKDEALQRIIDKPLIANPNGAGFAKAADFITQDDVEELDAHEGVAKNSFNGNIKFDFQPATNLNFTFGGSYNFATGGLRASGLGWRRYEMFSLDRFPDVTRDTYRGFVRFTQRFTNDKQVGDEEEASASIFSNAFYSVQLDYTKTLYLREDPLHRENIFDFGHVGSFDQQREKAYSNGALELVDKFGNDLDYGAQLTGYQFEGYSNTVVDYTPGTANPIAVSHNDQYFALAGDNVNFYRTPELIAANLGLINGTRSNSSLLSYSINRVPGTGSGFRVKGDNDQYRMVFNGSVDMKKPGSSDRNKHAVEFGFEYEQRVDRYHQINSAGLWDRMRQLVNSPNNGLERDKTLEHTYLMIDGERIALTDYQSGDGKGQPVFSIYDTITFDYTRTAQTYFDRQYRDQLGFNDINENPFVNTDAANPDELSLGLFSPDDLFGGGTANLTYYYGFDHLGNKLTSEPAFEDFWKRDAQDTLFYQRPVGAFRPVYMAGYIQDKFTFKDLIFNIGVRVDRFDANQKVLRDPYSLYGTVKAGDSRVQNLLGEGRSLPETIDNDFVVYVDNELQPTNITGFRNGDVWYNANGEEINDPNVLREGGSVKPYLSDPLGDSNAADDIKERDFVDKLNSSFEDYKPQINVMPRIAFSFPISDEATFFANYSVLTQRPQSSNRMSPMDYYFFRENSNSIFNNPNLKPEKTISYQVGFKQKVSRTSAMTISAFYREMRDMLVIRQIPLAYPLESYTTLDNFDFGTVKGFEFAYDLRRTGNIRLLANYTLQFADGTGSDAFGASNQIANGQGNIRSIRPLNFDSRHGITLTLDYRYSDGSSYNGPRIGDKNILANAGINMIMSASSGTPYSRQEAPGATALSGVQARAELEGQINGSRLPWNTRIGLNVDKDFKLNPNKESGKSDKFLNVYVQVQNLLNQRNILGVYAATGSGENDGYLQSSEGQKDAARQTDSDSYQLQYNYYMRNPLNFNLPRTIRVGASLSF